MKRYRAGSRAELGVGCNSKLTYGLKVVMKLICSFSKTYAFTVYICHC